MPPSSPTNNATALTSSAASDHTNNSNAALIEGWLKKRKSPMKGNKHWTTRYFVLDRTGMLSYYTRRSDVDYRGRMRLVAGCTVTWTSEYDGSGETGSDLLNVSNGKSLRQHDIHQHANRTHYLKITWPSTEIVSVEKQIQQNNNVLPKTNSFDANDADEPPPIASVRASSNHIINNNKKLKTKKRIIQGSKYAAATGAAVTVGVLTAGIGLAAALTFVAVSAAAGGGGLVATKTRSRSKQRNAAEKLGERFLSLSCANYEVAKQWKDALDKVISMNEAKTSDFRRRIINEEHTQRAIYNTILCTLHAGNETDVVLNGKQQSHGKNHRNKSNWKLVDGGWTAIFGFGGHGLRIYAEEVGSEEDRRARRPINKRKSFFRRELSLVNRPCPAFKSQVIINAKPLDAFCHLMTYGAVSTFESSGFEHESTFSFRVIETTDNHMDVIHLILRPLYLFPTWTAPRDFCLHRYWRFEDDGTYIICYDSVKHRECPMLPGYVRGELHGVYVISPKKSNGRITPYDECLMTQTVQVDPKGWVSTTKLPFLGGQGYADAFSVSSLVHMLDIRDALNYDRFVVPNKASDYLATQRKNMRARAISDVGFGDGDSKRASSMLVEVQEEDAHSANDEYEEHHDLYKEVEAKSLTAPISDKKLGETIRSAPPSFNLSMWAEPESKSFRVRGKHYTKDKKKISAGDSMFRLIAVDLVETDQNIRSGMCSHPNERVALAMKREAEGKGSDMPPFIFALNIAIPGPPFLHLVIYYAVDDITIINGKNNTPFSKLANQFFFGDSDEFRDNTFKLIPRIVEGNFIVRKAVGSTPAIMGTKLKQYYMRTDRYCEIYLDIGSSSVAAGVIRLASGYAKTLIVDMGFVLEGKDQSVLPEEIMGCCRLKNISFKGLRHVGLPDED